MSIFWWFGWSDRYPILDPFFGGISTMFVHVVFSLLDMAATARLFAICRFGFCIFVFFRVGGVIFGAIFCHVGDGYLGRCHFLHVFCMFFACFFGH